MTMFSTYTDDNTYVVIDENVVNRVIDAVEFYENRELVGRNMSVIESEIDSYWERNSETATEMD